MAKRGCFWYLVSIGINVTQLAQVGERKGPWIFSVGWSWEDMQNQSPILYMLEFVSLHKRDFNSATELDYVEVRGEVWSNI